MLRRLASLALLSISLVACAPSHSLTVTPSDAFLLAQQAQQGCLGTTLELFLELADRLAPLATARDLATLEARALDAGCVFTPGSPALLFCPALPLRGESLVLLVQVDYLSAGFPVADPSLADGLRLRLEGEGGPLQCEGLLEIVRDSERGFVVDGEFSALTRDGCTVAASAREVAGRLVADLPGGGSGFVFGQGEVEIEVRGLGGAEIGATAALVGREAFVAISVDGRTFTATLPLSGTKGSDPVVPLSGRE